MKWLMTFFLFTAVSTLKADVSPEHVESMLKQMVRENVISAEEAEKARLRMKSLSPDKWKAINHQAARMARRAPASVTPSQNKIEEVHQIDLDGAQFKAIESEMRKIVPQYND